MKNFFYRGAIVGMLAGLVLPASSFAYLEIWGPIKAVPALYDYDACNVKYVQNVAQSYDAHVGGTALSDKAAVLTGEINKLQSLVNDPVEYGKARAAAKNAHLGDIVSSFRAAGAGLNASMKVEIANEIKTHLQTLNSCYGDALRASLNRRISAYDAAIAAAEADITKLESKGVNTDELKQVIADAKAFVADLRSAVAAANTTEALRSVYRSRCLTNGCFLSVGGGVEINNNHFFGKYTVAKLNAITNFLEPKANEKGLGAEIPSIRLSINNIKAEIDAAGKQSYSAAQDLKMWNGLIEASAKLKMLWNKL